MKWSTRVLLAAGSLSAITALYGVVNIELSGEQKKLISNHKPIRVGITPGYAPFSYFKSDGTAAGIDVDLLQLISQRTGLKFEIIPGAPPWEEIWRMALSGTVDMTTSTVQIQERERVFKFTRAYGDDIVVIVARTDDYRFAHPALLRSSSAAQPRGYLISSILTNRVPTLHVQWFDTQEDCFKAVARGTAHATVVSLFVATQYLNEHPGEKLGICGVVSDLRLSLRMGLRHDYAAVVPIINETLASIPQQEMDTIVRKHLLFALEGSRQGALIRRRLQRIILAAIICTGVFLVWNFFMRREVLVRRAAEAKLRDMNQSLEVFSHSIAHDIKAPLRAIRGLSEALQQDYGSRLDTIGQDYLERIYNASGRMESLVQDVAAYSLAAQGQFVMSDVSVRHVIFQLIGEFLPEQRKYIHITSELPIVRAHPALLSQCLGNMLSNALKFTALGRTPDIRIWAEQDGSRVKISVQDNGIGIPSADLKRIFKLFERGAHSYEGTGIGLAVVAKGIERMGGIVGVESELDKGSRFWIELTLSNTGQAALGSQVRSGIHEGTMYEQNK
jgi:signal transduction histidine kinase